MTLPTTRICSGVYQVKGTNAFIVRVNLIKVGCTPASVQWTISYNEPDTNQDAPYASKREALDDLLNNQSIAIKDGLTLI